LDWSKAKNLIIGMLIIVNVFLLVVCWIAERNRLSIQDTAISQTVAYLAQHGTEVEPSLVSIQTDPRSVYLIERDYAAETLLAESLINGKEISRTGGIVRYSSADGSTSSLWRSGGLFEAGFMVEGSTAYAGDVQHHPAVMALQTVGISSSVLKEDRFGDLNQITLGQMMDEMPIFNATLTVTCGQDDAVYAAGRWCIGSVQAISSAEEMKLTGLLIRFIDQIKTEQIDLSHITDIRPGYVVQSLANSGVKLVPAWEITTPGTDSYISAVDGTILVLD